MKKRTKHVLAMLLAFAMILQQCGLAEMIGGTGWTALAASEDAGMDEGGGGDLTGTEPEETSDSETENVEEPEESADAEPEVPGEIESEEPSDAEPEVPAGTGSEEMSDSSAEGLSDTEKEKPTDSVQEEEKETPSENSAENSTGGVFLI